MTEKLAKGVQLPLRTPPDKTQEESAKTAAALEVF
jgi:hypothetical protein